MTGVSGILTQAPKHATPHGARGDHHLPETSRWTTPNRLRAGGALIGTVAVLTAVATASYTGSAHRHAADVLHTQAPSVHAAGDFLLRVEDMDAQLANALLISGDTSLRTTRAQSVQNYENERKLADADLQSATTALAGNPAALGRLDQVVDMFGSYEQLATRALQLDEQSATRKAGTAPADVVTAYRAALRYLAGDGSAAGNADTLVGRARGLYDLADADIGRSAQDAEDTVTNAQGVLFGFGLLLLGALGVVQWRMAGRFRRTVNPGLAAASLTAAALLVAGVATFQSAVGELHSGKADAFDSVQSLTMAKAISYDANADESRWLLDPADGAAYEANFLEKAKRIAHVRVSAGEPDVATYEKDVAQATQELVNGATSSPQSLASQFGTDSLLGFELNNITFGGEGAAALTVVSDYGAYLEGDAKIRAFQIDTPAGLHSAVDFDTDAQTPGTSDQTFDAYGGHLDDLIAINQAEFQSSMSAALSKLAVWAWIPYLFAALVVAFAALGLRIRLVEYR